MGGIGEFLFGAEGDVIEPQQYPTMTDEQMDLLEKLAGLLRGQVGEAAPTYPGEIVPGASPIQQALFALTGQGGPDVAGGGLKYLSDLLGTPYNPEDEMQYWTNAIKDPAMEMWQQDIIPAIQEKYAGMDALDSGASRRALARSGQNLTTSLNATLAQLLYGSKNQYEQNQLGAAGTGINLLSTLAGIGGQERGITAEGMQGNYQQWAAQQPWNNPWLQYLGTALGVNPYTIATPYQEQGSTGLLGSLVPMAAQGGMGALAGSFANNPQTGSPIGWGLGALMGIM